MVTHHKHKLTPMYCIHRLRKMLARGRSYGLPGTNGEWFSIFWHEICQEHTIASIFMAHPLHPFSRNERLMYMANAFSFVFLFSVLTSGMDSYASIALTCFFVVPYKMFLRTLLECSCIYTGAYDDKQEIDDGDNDPLNNNFSYCGCCLEMCGNLTSTLLNLWSVALVAAGVVIMLSDRGFGFFMNWVSSQTTSIFVTEFVMMGFFVYVNR